MKLLPSLLALVLGSVQLTCSPSQGSSVKALDGTADLGSSSSGTEDLDLEAGVAKLLGRIERALGSHTVPESGAFQRDFHRFAVSAEERALVIARLTESVEHGGYGLSVESADRAIRQLDGRGEASRSVIVRRLADDSVSSISFDHLGVVTTARHYIRGQKTLLEVHQPVENASQSVWLRTSDLPDGTLGELTLLTPPIDDVIGFATFVRYVIRRAKEGASLGFESNGRRECLSVHWVQELRAPFHPVNVGIPNAALELQNRSIFISISRHLETMSPFEYSVAIMINTELGERIRHAEYRFSSDLIYFSSSIRTYLPGARDALGLSEFLSRPATEEDLLRSQFPLSELAGRGAWDKRLSDETIFRYEFDGAVPTIEDVQQLVEAGGASKGTER